MHLDEGLDKLLHGQYDEALAAFEKCGTLPQAEKLCRITRMVEEQAMYAAELSKMNLAAREPGAGNHAAANMKNLHAKLKRLARQLLMATTGYPVPAIDYMGDLSESLSFLAAEALLRKRQVEHDRDHDVETGLLNRNAFIRGVYDMLRARPNKIGVLFCLSLDNIKYINDTHGYECGDTYIRKVVEVLRFYESDKVLIARAGGNEFAAYAHGFDHEDEACRFAQNSLKALLNTRVTLPREEVKIRASCGLAVYPHDAAASDTLMNYASNAMFEVKNLNRGTVMRFSPEIYRTKAGLLSRQERLDELIEERLIHFAFQPIISLRDASVAGYEALMRPKTPAFTSPLDILALAEAQSKLRQLERVTVEEIFKWIANNFEALKERKIFFNTISIHYLDAAELCAIHPLYEMITRSMVFELLETTAIEGPQMQKVNDFRQETSALIAIDDFGCGHSNALRLITISPDILKIDRFFITSIHDAPPAKKDFLSNILAYCRAKGIRTLAEGVETHEELVSVVRMGFDYAQGYYLGRPAFELTELDPRVKAEIMVWMGSRGEGQKFQKQALDLEHYFDWSTKT